DLGDLGPLGAGREVGDPGEVVAVGRAAGVELEALVLVVHGSAAQLGPAVRHALGDRAGGRAVDRGAPARAGRLGLHRHGDDLWLGVDVDAHAGLARALDAVAVALGGPERARVAVDRQRRLVGVFLLVAQRVVGVGGRAADRHDLGAHRRPA